jgi:hypothetical protein
MTPGTRTVPTPNAAGATPSIKVQPPTVTAARTRIAVLRLALVVGVVFLAPACGRKIGDECVAAADCNPNGSRQCDRSQPGGYCTIMGCDEKSCPEEAVCIRYFPSEYFTVACNPCCEDWPENSPLRPGCTVYDCPSGHPIDDCTVDEICLGGVCAPRSTERRFCALSCGGNDDCRGGYECRVAGTRGSLALRSDPNQTVSFCAPVVPP